MRDVLFVKGGYPLSGSVNLSGSKNAALPIIAASLLCEEQVKLRNIPRLNDVLVLINLIKKLGATIEWNDRFLSICVEDNLKTTIDETARLIRASILLAGPILAKEGSIKIPFPGGCNLGLRGIDLHLKAFRALGAKIIVRDDYIQMTSSGLNGARIELPFPSVGATENIIMASALARGTTIISNCAKEPEVADLGFFLRRMGLNISGIGSDIITIKGCERLKGCDYSIISDRIEAGTFISAALATGGHIKINNISHKYMRCILEKVKEVGGEISYNTNSLEVSSNKRIHPTNMVTGPYPGFPTDLHPIFVPLLSQANGVSKITETIYNNRFQYVFELNKLGINSYIDGTTLVINGPSKIISGESTCTDLRGGAAIIITALLAEGTTIIKNIYQIDRGYESIEKKLEILGAAIYRRSRKM